MFPKLVTDPAGLQTRADYDYRVMKPRQVTDPNYNSSSFTFTPLGLLAATWVQGKAGEGDQLTPSIQRQYDFLAFLNHEQPISVCTIRREYHDTQTEVPLPQRDQTIQISIAARELNLECCPGNFVPPLTRRRSGGLD